MNSIYVICMHDYSMLCHELFNEEVLRQIIVDAVSTQIIHQNMTRYVTVLNTTYKNYTYIYFLFRRTIKVKYLLEKRMSPMGDQVRINFTSHYN